MSKTNQQIITDAFTLAGVVAEGKQPTPSQSGIGMGRLNDNLLTQQRDGWRLGWYPQTVANLNSNAPLRDEDIGDVTLCLCAWLLAWYRRKLAPVTDPNDPTAIQNQIKDAFRRLEKRSLLYMDSDLGELSRPQSGPWGGPGFGL